MEFPKLKHPSNILVAGMSGVGKTHFVKNIIHHKLLTPYPSKVIWCYGVYQPLYAQMQGITFVEGVPKNLSQLTNCLIIFDDMMQNLSNSKVLTDLFTKAGHHKSLSIIFIVQNIFHKGSQMRDVSLNSHYLILFKNPRYRSQITPLGRPLYPSQLKYFQEVYQDATIKSYSYLFVDLKPETEEDWRLRTGIFFVDNYYVYQPK